MSVFFTRDLLATTAGDNSNPFELEIGETRKTKDISIPVPPGQFIAGASVTAIQNIPNFAKTIRRMDIERRYSGNEVRITTRGTNKESRFVARVSVAISTFGVSNVLSKVSGSPTDLTGQAFQLWANEAGATNSDGFATLPRANNAAIGSCFFFRTESANTIEIKTERQQDVIQYGNNYNSEKDDKITSTATLGASIILRCHDRKIWRVECVSDPTHWGL